MTWALMCAPNESSETTSGAPGRADVNAMYQQPIDLDELRLDLGDDEHAGVACAGIIYGDTKPALTEVGDNAAEPVEVADRGRR